MGLTGEIIFIILGIAMFIAGFGWNFYESYLRHDTHDSSKDGDK